MFNTAFTFGLTQFARSLSMPERLQKRPFRNAALEPWRFRNSSLDALFYDIKNLTAEEAFYISDSLAAEGMLMIVPPTGHGMLTLCDSVDEYLLRGGRDVHVMAVAGIGGSAAGAAAFARNVADAVDAPVAAVVSGYGLGDILSEAMGGHFFFGPLGFLRHNFEVIDDLVGRPQLGDYQRRSNTPQTPRPVSLDTDTVEALLKHEQLHFHLVTGHSKGNLIIAEALTSLENDAPERLDTMAETLQLISFGTRISVPGKIAPALSIMGELDWYGELNATAAPHDTIRVARSGHSTNSDMPGALKVTALLQEALAKFSTESKSVPQPANSNADVTPTVEQAAEQDEKPLSTTPSPDSTEPAETLAADASTTPEATIAPEEPPVLAASSPISEPAPEAPIAIETPTATAAATIAAAQERVSDTISEPANVVPTPKAKPQARPSSRRNRKR